MQVEEFGGKNFASCQLIARIKKDLTFASYQPVSLSSLFILLFKPFFDWMRRTQGSAFTSLLNIFGCLLFLFSRSLSNITRSRGTLLLSHGLTYYFVPQSISLFFFYTTKHFFLACSYTTILLCYHFSCKKNFKYIWK